MGTVEVNFNENEISNFTKTILNASTQAETKAIQESYSIIIKTAKDFNEKYKKMLNSILYFETLMKEVIKRWHSFKSWCKNNGENYKDTTEYDEYLKARRALRKTYFSKSIKEEILDVYRLAMLFQEYLNAALGQKVATSYVWVGAKKIPETYVIHDMSEFLKVDLDRYGNVVVRYRNNRSLLQKHTQKIEQSIKEDTEDFNYSLLRETYKESSIRYEDNKRSTGGSYIFWLNPQSGQKWHGALISSFGSINEAYSKFLLHEHFNATSVPEDNMEQFMNEVLGVTNLSGALQGDTTIQNLEMAIKSNKATTLSIQQLYQITQDIIQNKLNNFQAIQNYLIEKKKNNKLAENYINKDLTEQLQYIADTNVGQAVQTYINNLKK